ncbi:uncharacterized protein METZ01_LOCUS85966, partial [marine metagenome]
MLGAEVTRQRVRAELVGACLTILLGVVRSRRPVVSFSSAA